MNAAKTGKKIMKQLGHAKHQLRQIRRQVGGMGKTAVAGVTGAALAIGSAGRTVKDGAAALKKKALGKKKKSVEVIEVKKTTVIALLVALAAVAGVLGALYFYVLRREKELDEYEQLLFSEDFNDDLLEEDYEDEDEPAPAPAKGKAKA